MAMATKARSVRRERRREVSLLVSMLAFGAVLVAWSMAISAGLVGAV